MAIPPFDCVAGEVCCTAQYAIAESILDIAYNAVADCIGEPRCGEPALAGYVAMGARVEDPQSDYLTVSWVTTAASTRSADAGGRMVNPIYRSTFQVKLLESGYPMPTGDDEQIVLPTPQEYAWANAHLYAHGEAMFRALANALARGTLIPDDLGRFKRIEPLVPIEPSGGSAGWTVNLTIGFQ